MGPGSTLVIQSSRPDPDKWLQACMASVAGWARLQGYQYRYIDDSLFDLVPVTLREKLSAQKIIATDLARLKYLQRALSQGFETVIWCDADFLIFAPRHFQIPAPGDLPEGYLLGREVWVQTDNRRWRAYKKVHNAFLMFRAGNHFLDFYTEHAERLLWQLQGPAPNQFIGPKLLTSLHNTLCCPVLETAGMLSPSVQIELLEAFEKRECGGALTLFFNRCVEPLSAANLCSSLEQQIGPENLLKLIHHLMALASPLDPGALG